MEYNSREEYIQDRAKALQNVIVNYKQARTSVMPSCAWVYRNTYCDVISVITTTVPISNGQMNDIKLLQKDPLRSFAIYFKKINFISKKSKFPYLYNFLQNQSGPKDES